MNMQLGLEEVVRLRPARLDGARIGLLMNRASVDRDLRHACDLLAEAYPGQLAALFTPQHGLWGDRQANMLETPHSHHARLGVPIHSLYSDTRRPTPEMLTGLDCLVIDLQDVGTRVYTFIWTIVYCLEACAAAGLRVLLLDHPNPLGGRQVEGPLLDRDMTSFVGLASIPMRHGLTIGELAQLVNVELQIGADLEVMPLQGWSRSELFDSLDRIWIPPSPNLPRFESALLYPGQVLLEGTNLSEGRGTTTPFEVVGAPYVDPEVLLNVVSRIDLPGVRFLPIRFTATFDKWVGESCGGLSLHVTDRFAFRPYRTTVAIVDAVRRLWPKDFAWRLPPYEYETEKPPIDIISGSNRLRERVDQGEALSHDDWLSLAVVDEHAWWARALPYCLYAAGR